ncbi:MAG: hypothetical protein WA691_10265 [Thermoplasmata archaeon]
MRHDRDSPFSLRGGRFAIAATLLILLATLAAYSAGAPRVSGPSGGLELASGSVTISQFSFQPSNANPGTQVTGTVGLSGGTAPYYLWFNNTPPDCSPSNNPVMSSSTTFTFQCTPTSTGSYSIQLEVVDSSTPATKASQTATLNVESGSNGSGNGNGNNSNNGNNSLSSLIPSGFLTIGLILVIVFMGAIIAIAAGVVALAVLVPRRLRQLNESLAKGGLPPKESKPPT